MAYTQNPTIQHSLFFHQPRIEYCTVYVDINNHIHKVQSLERGVFDVVISTEMLEHDKYYKESLKSMIEYLKPNGLFILTCATKGRRAHGIKSFSPQDSPLTTDYYKNIEIKDFSNHFNYFYEYFLEIDETVGDFRFAGIKR